MATRTKKHSQESKRSQRSGAKQALLNGSLSPVDGRSLKAGNNDTFSDSNSDVSSNSERRVMRRSSLICSSGKDKFTYDSEHADVPLRSVDMELESNFVAKGELSSGSASEQASLVSDGENTNVVKRDSVVHPGRMDLQRSLFVNGRYQNPWPTWRPPTFTNILKFGLSRDKSNVPSKTDLDLALPILSPDLQQLARPPGEGMRITWLGHSTVLVQFDGISILTDPIFSDRASPSQVVGPKRYREVPCSVHELPEIHAVLISHVHYDHLDLNTVTLLNARFGVDLRWFVPMGLSPWMQQVGVDNVVELDWWQESLLPDASDVSVVFTPTQHWGKRTITDDNKVLWGSWCVLGPKHKFFFAGDTGYCDAFKQIGRMYGPFHLSAIPIGAYEPRWFMKYNHVNPEESVKIHEDLGSKYSLAVHWGTFCLANEYYLDPPMKLHESLDKRHLPKDVFFTLKHGETRVLRFPCQVPQTT